MGMFDNIIFNKSVLEGLGPQVDKYLQILKYEEVSLQTKDFDCLMVSYFIEDGKLLWEKVESEWVEGDDPLRGFMKPISREKLPYNKTCTVRAYDCLQSETVDIWIEFEMVFIEGVLQKITLIEYKETDSAPRIERSQQWQKELEESIKFGKTFRGKVQRAFGRFLGKLSRKIINFGNLIQRISFKF
jgi:hypothetical protein